MYFVHDECYFFDLKEFIIIIVNVKPAILT